MPTAHLSYIHNTFFPAVPSNDAAKRAPELPGPCSTAKIGEASITKAGSDSLRFFVCSQIVPGEAQENSHSFFIGNW